MVDSDSAAARQDRAKVFVSYSRKDAHALDRLVEVVEKLGFQPLVDRSEIAAAELWKARLESLIVQADAVVFVVSPHSIASEVCGWEVERCLQHGKKLIPIVWRRVKPSACPPGIVDRNWIFATRTLSGLAGSTVKALGEALRQDLEWERERSVWLDRAERWLAEGRNPGRVLRGEEITAAEAWAARRPLKASNLSDTLLAYFDASRERERRDHDRRRSITAKAFVSPITQALEAQEPDRALRLMATAAMLADDIRYELAPQLWLEGAQSILLAPVYCLSDPSAPDSVQAPAEDEGKRRPLCAVSSDARWCALHQMDGVLRLSRISDGAEIWSKRFDFDFKELFVTNGGEVWGFSKLADFIAIHHDGQERQRARCGSGEPGQGYLPARFDAETGRLFVAFNASLWCWDGDQASLVRTFASDVVSFDYSPLAKRGVAILDGEEWFAETFGGAGSRKYDWADDSIYSGSISRDGGTIALAARKKAEVYDFNAPAPKATVSHRDRLSAIGDDMHCLALSGDGKRLLTSANDSTARVWDTADGREVLRVDHVTEAMILTAEFAANDKVILTSGTDCTTRLWSAATGRCLLQVSNRHNANTVGWDHMGHDTVGLSHDGAHLWTFAWGGLLQIWQNRLVLEEQLEPPNQGSGHRHASSVQIPSNSAHAIIARTDGKLQTVSLNSSKVLNETPIPAGRWETLYLESTNSIVFGGNGCFSCDIGDGAIQSLSDHKGPVSCLRQTAGGGILVGGSGREAGGFVDLISSAGKLLAQLTTAEPVKVVHENLHNGLILIADREGAIIEWDTAGAVRPFAAFSDRVDAITTDRRSGTVFIAGDGIWTTDARGENLRQLAQTRSSTRQMALNADGTVLFVWTMARVLFHDAQSGAVLLDLSLPTAQGEVSEDFEACALTPDWRRLVGVTDKGRRIDFELSDLASLGGDLKVALARALGRGNEMRRLSERHDILMSEQPPNLREWFEAAAHERAGLRRDRE